MKKLNNNGSGLTQMLIFCAILLIALFIAAYLIYRLYQSIGL